MDTTNITELAQFFPSNHSTQKTHAAKVRVVPWHAGETYEEALKRHEEKGRRIERQLAARQAAAAGKGAA